MKGFSLRLCSMLEEKLGVDLPKQGFGLPMRWRRRSKKSKYFGAPLTDHDGNLSAFNGTRQWREYLASILIVVLLVVGFWKHSRNILKIFHKYPRNIEDLSEKMPRVVLFVLRRAVPRRNIKGSSGWATALFYISTSILNKRPFNLKLACIVHLHYIWISKLNKRPLKSLKMPTHSKILTMGWQHLLAPKVL